MRAIETEDLTKDFNIGFWRPKPYRALDRLTMTVEEGEVFGFLGPNGAGKSTTLKLLMGLIFPTSGVARILGKPVGDLATRRRYGFLPENPSFYDYLTAEELLTYFASLHGLSGAERKRRVATVLDDVQLGSERRMKLRSYSKGMIQRVGVAQALINEPALVFLDEPMSGLDPLGRKQVRDLILSLRDQGKTIFFSTHIIPDVEMICDRVGIIFKGKMLAAGRVDELVSHGHTHTVEVVCEGMSASGIDDLARVSARVLSRGRQCFIVLQRADALEEALAMIRKHGAKLVSVTPQKGSLEELFMPVSGHPLGTVPCGK
jgi:ABC-2 type transport system ATP-binding protein